MSDIYSIQQIRSYLQARWKTQPDLHVNVSLAHPKLQLRNVPVKIVGVYAHIFQIEENTQGRPQRHTLQYADVLHRSIEFLDADDLFTAEENGEKSC